MILKRRRGLMAKHWVKCALCQMQFDANSEENVKISARRYAHLKCVQNEEAHRSQEEKDKQALEEYIIHLFDMDFLDPKVRKLIASYQKEYNYTYSGMLKALTYFYEIKKGDKNKANNSIGIIPYIYNEAYRYYYSLWEAQQKNKDKNIERFSPVVKEIVISPPKRNVKIRKLFSFLDEDEV